MDPPESCKQHFFILRVINTAISFSYNNIISWSSAENHRLFNTEAGNFKKTGDENDRRRR